MLGKVGFLWCVCASCCYVLAAFWGIFVWMVRFRAFLVVLVGGIVVWFLIVSCGLIVCLGFVDVGLVCCW